MYVRNQNIDEVLSYINGVRAGIGISTPFDPLEDFADWLHETKGLKKERMNDWNTAELKIFLEAKVSPLDEFYKLFKLLIPLLPHPQYAIPCQNLT
jgi:hypothetical protein